MAPASRAADSVIADAVEGRNSARTGAFETAERAAMRRVARAAAGGAAESVIEAATRAAIPLLEGRAAHCIRLDDDTPRVVRTEPAGAESASAALGWPVAELRCTRQRCRVVLDAGREATAVPVLVGDRLWGALVVESDVEEPIDGFDGRGLGLAEILGATLAALRGGGRDRPGKAIDGLGISDAGDFRVRLGQEVERARRYVRDLSLVLLDLDHLKSVNGLRGSEVGDRFIADFGEMLAESARAGDVVGRLGGSEFGWILPEAAGDRAQRAAERFAGEIEMRLAGLNVPLVVAGVAELTSAADALELYEHARLALTCSRLAGDGSCAIYSGELASAVQGDGVRHAIERSQTLVGLRAMARALDAKDPFTQRHSERVAELAGSIAAELSWSARDARMLRQAALVHDVGKIGVPDAVLFKPERLTDIEYEQVKAHAPLGAEIVSGALAPLQVAWVRGHHERWDGGGYPDRLSGDQIPEGARILALADAWDAMTTERSYAVQRSRDDAIEECCNQSGRQFWSAAVDALTVLSDTGGLTP